MAADINALKAWRQENADWLKQSFDISMQLLQYEEENNLTPKQMVKIVGSEYKEYISGRYKFSQQDIAGLEACLNIKLI